MSLVTGKVVKGIWAEDVKLDGFKGPSGGTTGRNFEWRWNRVTRDKKEVVSLHFRKGPFGFQIENVSFIVSFKTIEDIVSPIFEGHKVANHRPYTIRRTFGQSKETPFKQICDVEIVNEDKAHEVGLALNSYLQKVTSKFFNDFRSISLLAQYTSNKSPADLATFIRQPLPARLLLIKKIGGAEDYNVYKENLIEAYEGKADKNNTIAAILQIVMNVETLASLAPNRD